MTLIEHGPAHQVAYEVLTDFDELLVLDVGTRPAQHRFEVRRGVNSCPSTVHGPLIVQSYFEVIDELTRAWMMIFHRIEIDRRQSRPVHPTGALVLEARRIGRE